MAHLINAIYSLPPYVRSIVYNYHFQNTYSIREWTDTLRLYENVLNIQEQERLLKALSFSRLPSLLNK
jgi:hypothetical protein